MEDITSKSERKRCMKKVNVRKGVMGTCESKSERKKNVGESESGKRLKAKVEKSESG